MSNTAPRVLFVQTFYPEFLHTLYAEQPQLKSLPFAEQSAAVFDTAFGIGDAYSHELRTLGCDAREVICNAEILQSQWAGENDVNLIGNEHDRRRQILAAQIAHFQPDVLYVFEWSPLGDTFLAEIKSQVGSLVGQIASPLPTNRTFAAYDLMVSSFPPIVKHFNELGVQAAHLRLGFDRRVLDRLADKSKVYDVTFVGGFAPSHPDRISWLETLLEDFDINVFGYGQEQIAEESPVRTKHHGERWGRAMFDVLHQSRITLNRHAHIDVRGCIDTSYANNMRLYEATGVGTCLITESRSNLADLFVPGREVVTYRDDRECVEKVRYYLAHAEARREIAKAGQARALQEHTYAHRMADLKEILTQALSTTGRTAGAAQHL